MSPHRVTADQLLSVECITRGHPLPELAEAIARALGEAERRGRQEQEAEIVGWLRDDAFAWTAGKCADELERGAGRKEKP